jgi:diacylglycerol kinase
LKPDKSQQQKFSTRKRFHSFQFAFKGIRHALATEHNFRIHIASALLVIIAGFYFQIEKSDWTFLAFAIGFVFVAELFNSAIELLADVVSPGENETIGKLKDICAAAVLVAAITAVITGTLIFWPYAQLKWFA